MLNKKHGEKRKFGYKEREQMYRLMISQLFYDGYQSIAVSLSSALNAHPACPPSDRLFHVLSGTLRNSPDPNSTEGKMKRKVAQTGIDLEQEGEVEAISPEISAYETCYVTAHKGPCRAGAFNSSGTLIATGSDDSSIKVLDVDRMLSKSVASSDNLSHETPQQQMENHPVIRTLYDHCEEVTCLSFHPTNQILASGSADYSVKLFDFSKSSVKKAYKSLQEAAPIRSIDFHPSGDYLLVGTEHQTMRLYDLTTSQCFVSTQPKDQHHKAITCVNYSKDARLAVTSSEDGDIRIWDGISNRCVCVFNNAHDKQEVCSVQFSKNSKYVLSSGKDSIVKLWELATSRCLIAYTGAGVTGKQEQRTQAVFNHTEDYILFPDEKTTSLCSWDARNADRQKLLALGHNGAVRKLVHSPVSAAFITCSEDHRARFWYRGTDE